MAHNEAPKYVHRSYYSADDGTVSRDMNSMFEFGYRVVATASTGSTRMMHVTFERIDD